MKRLLLLFTVNAAIFLGDGSGVALSRYSAHDFQLTTDPAAEPWKNAPVVIADHGAMGEALPKYRTEIRSRWSDRYLYFLFICPYETLHLKPNPVTEKETYGLWEWDVAEVFISDDFEHIRRYKEFEISPRAEWVDLDIDRDSLDANKAWLWNSGFKASARIDAQKKIWYGVMQIPMDKILRKQPANGVEMRVNLYRCQGSDPNRKYIAWQPTHDHSFHVPEAFGRLRLVGK